jgi:hypothetical protein
MLRPDGQTIEWYPDVKTLEARWAQLRQDLESAGWDDLRSPRASA